MLSYWTPGSIVAFDLGALRAVRREWPASGRIGTVIRPGVRISPPVIPFYIRGALPINVETANGERELLDLRLGAGINIPLVLFKIYVEADVDFPLSSKDPRRRRIVDQRLQYAVDPAERRPGLPLLAAS